ncbi:hypothetical protein B0H11DRAFT_1911278 [Mycena galericulata]|nr:hypothetical protein B0H11DRAFT_1911278 [Mycena galericulata]
MCANTLPLADGLHPRQHPTPVDELYPPSPIKEEAPLPTKRIRRPTAKELQALEDPLPEGPGPLLDGESMQDNEVEPLRPEPVLLRIPRLFRTAANSFGLSRIYRNKPTVIPDMDSPFTERVTRTAPRYQAQIFQGELQHRVVKRWNGRSSKNNATPQIIKMDVRESAHERMQQELVRHEPVKPVDPVSLDQHHRIAKDESTKVYFSDIEFTDPAFKTRCLATPSKPNSTYRSQSGDHAQNNIPAEP